MPSLKNSLRYLGVTMGMNFLTPEAATFISTYRNILDELKQEIDSFLEPLETASVLEVLQKSKPFINKIAEKQKSYDNKLDLYMPCHATIYLLCKKVQPQKIIETGIEKGGSTYMILSALQRNNSGHLWSIDIRSYWTYFHTIVARIGPLVTTALRSRWTVIKGDAQKVLEQVFDKTGKIDIFLALQGHTYDVQKHECTVSWPMIKNGGVLVLDRPDWNNSQYLKEFLETHADEILYHETFKEGSIDDPFEFTVILKK